MGTFDEKRGVDRRTFLFELAAIGLSTSVLPSCASALSGMRSSTPAPSANRIGVQLYTVRDLMEKDFDGTLGRVAQIGYKEVEFAGYYNRSPQQVRAILDRLGLVSPSAHVGAQQMRQDAAGQINAAKVIGQEYITIPSYNFARDGGVAAWKQGAAEFNRWGAMCRDAGLRLAYHNHAAEFAKVSGTTAGYDILVADVDPKLVDFELDIYWATFADQDPIALFAKYPGRFALWHVKDMRVAPGGGAAAKSMSPVGEGTIDYKTVFAHAREAGMRHFFVEHDTAASFPGGSLASLQSSYTNLHRMLA